MQKTPDTLLIDIDGTLLKQIVPVAIQAIDWSPPEVLPGAIEKLVEWERMGCKIILTTGRKPAYRKFTVWQLRKAGIFYDHLIMGVGTGRRVLINDMKPGDPTPKAIAYNLERNLGLSSIELS